MPYDPQLAERVRQLYKGKHAFDEKLMFGGICFLTNGNMCCGITNKGELMLRVAKDQYSLWLKEKNVKPMMFTGREMKGFLYIKPEGIRTATTLKKWIDRSLDYVKTLPKKKKKQLL